MINNIKHNRMWLMTGIETLSLGVFFVFYPLFFRRGPTPPTKPIDTFFDLLDDKPVALLLVAVGVYSIIISLWNIHRFYAKQIMTGSLQLVWTIFALAFLYADIRAHTLGFVPILSISVMLRIFLEAAWGDDS